MRLLEQAGAEEPRDLVWRRDWMPPQSRQQVAPLLQLPPAAEGDPLARLPLRLPRLDRKDAETFWWPGIQ